MNKDHENKVPTTKTNNDLSSVNTKNESGKDEMSKNQNDDYFKQAEGTEEVKGSNKGFYVQSTTYIPYYDKIKRKSIDVIDHNNYDFVDDFEDSTPAGKSLGDIKGSEGSKTSNLTERSSSIEENPLRLPK